MEMSSKGEKDCALANANIKSLALGTTLVKKALQHHLPPGALAVSILTMPSLVRTTNRLRQSRRPAQPTNHNSWSSPLCYHVHATSPQSPDTGEDLVCGRCI